MIQVLLDQYYVNGYKLKYEVKYGIVKFLDWAFDTERMRYINVNEYMTTGKECEFRLIDLDELIYELICKYKEDKFFEDNDFWDDIERTKVNDIYEYTYKGRWLVDLDSVSDFNIDRIHEINRDLM
jgi:hypothetical protein